jgi:ferredoxin
MSKFRITVSDECIGCGQCVNACDNFDLGDDGKSHPKKEEVEDKGCNEAAADVCPVHAIKIEETD